MMVLAAAPFHPRAPVGVASATVPLVLRSLSAFWFFVSLRSVASFAVPSAAVVPSAVAAASMGTSTAARPPPIVYTIAGSDSGGGAGIQADLAAIRSMGCHGCSAVTCLTAQNSVGVTAVHAPPADFLGKQLDALMADLPPRAIKVGMLGSAALAGEVGAFLRSVKGDGGVERPFVVVDPVMISTSGHALIDDDAKAAMVREVFPFADVVTPNKFEAEALLGRRLRTPADVEAGAQEILAMGPRSVLIKGGHSLVEEQAGGGGDCATQPPPGCANATLGYAQDYLLTSVEFADEGRPVGDRPRLCDGSRGVWLRNDRYDSENTHGTGCSLSSAIASALALGHDERGSGAAVGAKSAIRVVDACCLAKAYVNAGIAKGVQLGKGPGPVVHTGFPTSYRHYPTVALVPESGKVPAFLPMTAFHARSSPAAAESTDKLGRILPIVDTVEWVERLTSADGISDLQLRFKDTDDHAVILDRIQRAQALCRAAGVRLWINDHWEAAIEAGECYGIHLGQEDLAECADVGGLKKIRDADLALGVSTHSFAELSAALAVRPSYVSLGPVFNTSSKDVKFEPQGSDTVRRWRGLLPPDIPLVAIGGISDKDRASLMRRSGADCVAVIGAVTKADDVGAAIAELNSAVC